MVTYLSDTHTDREREGHRDRIHWAFPFIRELFSRNCHNRLKEEEQEKKKLPYLDPNTSIPSGREDLPSAEIYVKGGKLMVVFLSAD